MKKALVARRDGYTLVEVFIAMMVFALGILALYRLQIASLQYNTYASQLTEATNLAAEKMNLLKLTNYSDLSDSDGDGLAGLDHRISAAADGHESNGAYNIFWNVAVDHPVANAKIIRVIVCWRDPGKPHEECAHSVFLDSITAKPD